MFFRGEGVHKLKVEVGRFANLSGKWGGEWPGKKGSVFSPILKDRVHAMTLSNLKTPKQKENSGNDCMTA